MTQVTVQLMESQDTKVFSLIRTFTRVHTQTGRYPYSPHPSYAKVSALLKPSMLGKEQMLSVLRLTDFLPSNQQIHIPAIWRHGTRRKKHNVRLKASLFGSILLTTFERIIRLVSVVSLSPGGEAIVRT